MRRVLFAAALIATISPVAAAQAPPPASAPNPRAAASSEAFDAALAELLARPGGLTAEAAARRAVQANVTVARKRAETEQTRTQLGAIDVALVPITRLSASYTRLSDIDAPVLGPGISFPVVLDSMRVGAEVGVPVTDLVMRLPPARRAIEAEIAAGELVTRATEREVAAQTEVLYYEWVRASLGVVAATRQVAQVEATRAQVAALAEFQRAGRADVMQLDAQKAQAELRLAQLQQLVVLRAEQLRIAMGAAPEEPLDIGEDVRVVAPVPALADTAVLTADALRTRLEGRALDAGLRAVAEHRREAEVERLPKLNLYAQLNYDSPNQRIFPQSDEFNLTWAAGVQLSWSLNGFLNVRPTVRAIDAQARALTADRHAFELGVRGQIAAGRAAADLAEAAYAASQRGLAAAEESYQVRLDLFDNDRATTLEVASAETALTAARIAAIDALIDRRIAWTQLRHAAGLDLGTRATARVHGLRSSSEAP